ncbi:MAG: rhodanese-like domain-containing protein, partial [Chloroflexi bacterium]|nr:rhodanese-like domain-containing protein [Chloroflexota bacterium]
VEWELGHVPGALLISLGELRDRIAEVPRDRELAIICEAGVRSSMAASLLESLGYQRLVHALEGTAGYRNAGLPLEYAPEMD